MKQKDLLLIAVIVIVSAVFSIVISKAIIGTPKTRQQQAEVVQPIGSEFPQPDNRYFNNQAYDPAKPITVGQNANNTPFSGQ